MVRAAVRTHVTYAEYLAFENASSDKHEYYDGVIYAMAGGTPEHAFLAGNVIGLLGNLVSGRPCVVGTSDVRVFVPATGLSTYPEVSVVCGPFERAPDDPNAVTNPLVLVEVLSESTEAYDRGEKFAHYRRIASLREYVLVSQHEARVEVFRRDEQREWVLAEARRGESVALASLGGALEVDEVYRGVTVPVPAGAA